MPFWRILTLLLVVAVAGINLWRTAGDGLRTLRHPVADPVMAQEQRFAALRRTLLERGISGTAGYFADVPKEKVFAGFATVSEYYQMQYALAPLVLDLNTEHHPWAVANFRTAAAMPPGFKVVQDFGQGVFLLQQAAP
ncbi:MAG: hypothetical protein PSU94_09440 [Lacunisphaera sp.]|nr:hypothetical protein [Lacunisphaera sp.]